jgi:HSP20 family protein
MKWFRRKASKAEEAAAVQTGPAADQTGPAAKAPPTGATVPASTDGETSAAGDTTAPADATAATPATTTAATPTKIAVTEGSPAPVASAPAKPRPGPGLELIRLDEYRQDGALVVRAELPGLDPDKDVHVSVANGRVQIDVEHREQDEVERNGYRVQELRYGRLSRSVPFGEGVPTSAITATYNNGVLEVRIPEPPAPQPTRIPITAS